MGRDITERVEAEHRLRALNDKLERQVERRNRFMRLLREMAILANESGSVEEAMRRALDLLCASLGWPAGHVFLSDPAHPECLVDAGIWRLDSPPDFRSFVEVTRRTAFRCGEGFLGTAAACAVPRWISDVSADPRIACAVPRPPIRTLLLFPLLVGRRVAGVLELFSREAAAPDEGLLRGLLPCGAQLGRIVERREIERQVADASLEEQRRIGHELHDTLGQ
jgi:GAF domain-containing protein